jgi:hypothetical protein
MPSGMTICPLIDTLAIMAIETQTLGFLKKYLRRSALVSIGPPSSRSAATRANALNERFCPKLLAVGMSHKRYILRVRFKYGGAARDQTGSLPICPTLNSSSR